METGSLAASYSIQVGDKILSIGGVELADLPLMARQEQFVALMTSLTDMQVVVEKK